MWCDRFVEEEAPVDQFEPNLVERSDVAVDSGRLTLHALDGGLSASFHPVDAVVGVPIDSVKILNLLQFSPGKEDLVATC